MTLSFFPRALGLTRHGLLLGLASLTFACAPGAQAAPDIQMSYRDFTGIHIGKNSGYGSVMAAAGDWLAVGAPYEVLSLSGVYKGGKVCLWKRDATTGTWQLRQSLTFPGITSTTNTGYRFGSTLAMQGTRLIVGSSPSYGTHHVFRLENDAWVLDGTLYESANGSSSSLHRRILAISGDVAAIGCPDGYLTTPTSPGGWVDIYIRQSPGTWTRQTRLLDSTAGNNMGSALSFLGDRLLIGCPRASVPLNGSTVSSAGKIMIYERSASTGDWTKVQDVTAVVPTSSENFASHFQIHEDRLYALGRVGGAVPRLHELSISGGFSQVNLLSVTGLGSELPFIATDGSRLALGSQHDTNSKLFLYHRSTSGDQAWISQTHHVDVPSGIGGDEHHSALWISGQLLLGGYMEVEVSSYPYTARDWTVRIATTDLGTWSFMGRLQPPDILRMEQATFGGSISRDGDWLIIGAPSTEGTRGYAYAYKKGPDGSLRFHSALPEPVGGPMPLQGFGSQVACRDGRVLVGASTSTGSGFVDAAFLYVWDATTDRWVLDHTFGSMLLGGLGYGSSVALSADLAVISDLGASRVYVYRRSGTTWTQEAELSGPSGTSSEAFGCALSLEGTRLLIGAPQTGKGSAYVFERNSTDLTTASPWTRVARLAPPSGLGSQSQFGSTVSLSGDRALVSGGLSSAPASIYRRKGSAWSLHMKLPAEAGGTTTDILSALISGPVALVNAKGSVSLFGLSGDKWIRISPSLNSGTHSAGGAALLGQDVFFAGAIPDGITIDGLTGRVIGRNLSIPPLITWSGDVSSNYADIGVPGIHLDADSYLLGAKNDRMVKFRLQGQGILPVRVDATLTGDTADGSLTATGWDIGIAGEAEAWLRFHPKIEGDKILTLTFTTPGTAAPLATYHVHVSALTEAIPVEIIEQPQSALIYGPLGTVPLTPLLYGTRPWTCRWLKNGSTVSGQTAPYLNVTTPGSYQLEVSGPGGGKVRSQAAAIGHWEEQTPPFLYTLAGQTVRLSLTAAGPGMQITWLNAAGELLEDGPVYTGTRSPTLTIKNPQHEHAQDYQARIHMPIPYGAYEEETYFGLTVISPPQLSILGPDDGRLYIGQPPDIQFPVEFENPEGLDPVYTITGLPPGLSADATGTLTGTPTRTGSYSIRASARIGAYSTAAVTSTFIVTDGGLSTPGLYWGQILPGADFPLAGAVSLDLRHDGSYTGSLMAGGKKHSLSGRLTAANLYRSTPVRLAHPFSAGPQLMHIGTSGVDELALIIAPVSQPENRETLSTLRLIRSALPLGPAPDASRLGKYNFALLRDGSDESTPGGHGFGTLTLSAGRSGTFAGQLADGTRITGSGWLSDANPSYDALPSFHFYSTDSAKKQSLSGSVHITAPPSDAQAQTLWARLPGPGRIYPGGFEQVPCLWYSSRYQAASAGTTFSSSGSQLRLTPGNSSDTYSTSFQFSSKLKATFGTGDLNPQAIKLSVTSSTGLLSGQFTLKDPDPADETRTLTRTATFKGILLPDLHAGYGCFTLPALPDPIAEPPTTLKTSPIYSGAIEIEP